MSLFLLVAALAAPLAAQEEAAVKPQKTANYTVVKQYPLEGCVVSDRPLEEGKAKTFEVQGRVLRTCCAKCQKKVEDAPEEFVARIDAALIAAQQATYPLETCPVSGKKIGSMGKGHDMVVAGTLVRLCCEQCVDKANKLGEQVVRKIQDAAYQKQLAAYPTDKCVVSGHELDTEDPTDVMYGTTLVRLCCEDCVGDLQRDPAKFLTKLAPNKAKQAEQKAEKAADKAEKAIDKAKRSDK
jgi:hypothetical protein